MSVERRRREQGQEEAFAAAERRGAPGKRTRAEELPARGHDMEVEGVDPVWWPPAALYSGSFHGACDAIDTTELQAAVLDPGVWPDYLPHSWVGRQVIREKLTARFWRANLPEGRTEETFRWAGPTRILDGLITISARIVHSGAGAVDGVTMSEGLSTESETGAEADDTSGEATGGSEKLSAEGHHLGLEVEREREQSSHRGYTGHVAAFAAVHAELSEQETVRFPAMVLFEAQITWDELTRDEGSTGHELLAAALGPSGGGGLPDAVDPPGWRRTRVQKTIKALASARVRVPMTEAVAA